MSSPTLSEEPNASPPRLLIVEDEFLVAMMAEEALTSAGYEIVGVASGFEEAVSLAEQARPDLVLMDIQLASKRDGVDAAIEIKKRYNIRSLFLSGNQDRLNMERAEAAEPVGWLPKPYAVDRLIRDVKKALGLNGNMPDRNNLSL